MNSGVVNLAESLSKDLKTGEEKKDLFLYDNEMRTHCGVICGIDEAGRGPLAGDVYAAAVILALLFYKLVVRATLDNSALLKHHNTIGVAHG